MKARYCLIFSALIATPAVAEPMTPSVKAMIEKAAQSGDQAKIDAVVSVAKSLHPESAGEIDGTVAAVKADREVQRQEKPAKGGFFDNWTGSGEVGGSFATGNSTTKTVAVGVALKKDGLRWRQALQAKADFQRSDGQTDQERFAASYQIDRKLNKHLYVFANVGWERDQGAGLNSRFTETLGLGYRVVDRPSFTWDLEGGPALRQARFIDRDENGLAFRAASKLGWTITPGIAVTQVTNGFFEGGTTSATAETAITGQLVGALSARLSFNVLYESDPPIGLKHIDTVTRATLVYGF